MQISRAVVERVVPCANLHKKAIFVFVRLRMLACGLLNSLISKFYAPIRN